MINEISPVIPDRLLPVCMPLLFISGAYYFFIHTARVHSQKAKLPKYDTIPNRTVKSVPSKQLLRDLSGNIDVAIVGSGIGALSTAATLARQGLKVAVFEQNQTVGGKKIDGYALCISIISLTTSTNNRLYSHL